jgi:two-component system response regulator (stage 0 sporulation protein F)
VPTFWDPDLGPFAEMRCCAPRGRDIAEQMAVLAEQKSILIVDDERGDAFVLETTLKTLGKFSVVSVSSAEEALEQLARQPFDLMVTDLRMPGMSGLELVRYVKDSHPQTRTMLITAYASEDVEAEVRHLQPVSYLTKPFAVKEFAQAVERALESVQAPAAPAPAPLGRAEAVQRILATLRQATGARYALLAGREGQVVAQTGIVEGLPVESILSVLMEEASITALLDHHLEGGADISLHHYEGEQYQVYAAVAATGPLLLVVLGQQPPPRRLGVVWLFLRRALREARALLGKRETGPLSPTGGATGFGSLTPDQVRALGLVPEEADHQDGDGQVEEGMGEREERQTA